MSEVDVYEYLNKIRLPAKREKFPYDLEFTKKIIELKTDNGKIFYSESGDREIRSGDREIRSGGKIKIYEFSNSRHLRS